MRILGGFEGLKRFCEGKPICFLKEAIILNCPVYLPTSHTRLVRFRYYSRTIIIQRNYPLITGNAHGNV